MGGPRGFPLPNADAVAYAALLAIYVGALLIRLHPLAKYGTLLQDGDALINVQWARALLSQGMPPLALLSNGPLPGFALATAALHKLLSPILPGFDLNTLALLIGPFTGANTALAVYWLTQEIVSENLKRFLISKPLELSDSWRCQPVLAGNVVLPGRPLGISFVSNSACVFPPLLWSQCLLGSSKPASPRLRGEEAQLRRVRGAALAAAAMAAFVPGCLPRTVAGGPPSPPILFLLTLAAWARALRTGSLIASVGTSLFFLVSSCCWDGAPLIPVIIGAHTAAVVASGLFSGRLHLAYTLFYVLGVLASIQLPFNPSSFFCTERVALLLLLLAIQLSAVKSVSSPFRIAVWVVTIPVLVAALASVISGSTSSLQSSSASGQQPPTWASFFVDMHVLAPLTLAGMWACSQGTLQDERKQTSLLREGDSLLCVTGVCTLLWSAVAVEALTLFTPVACALSGIALSNVLYRHLPPLLAYAFSGSPPVPSDEKKARKAAKAEEEASLVLLSSGVVVGVVCALLVLFVGHSAWASSRLYSSPTLLLPSRTPDGDRFYIDDFSEAYSWIRHNTAKSSSIGAWWDYGHHIAALGNRPALVSGHTTNATTLATVARALAVNASVGVPLLHSLGASHVMAVCGGYAGYSADDVNKFLWMLRLGGVGEAAYRDQWGELAVGKSAPDVMTHSLLYTLCYHGFGDLKTHRSHLPGYDRVRGTMIGRTNIPLQGLEEVLTTEHWIVRVYKLSSVDVLST